MDRKDCDRQATTNRRSAQAIAALMTCGVAHLFCASPARGESVRLLPSAMIHNGRVQLKDVAVLEGFAPERQAVLADLVVKAGLDVGRPMQIPLSVIREKLVAAGVNPATVCLRGSMSCTVRRLNTLPPAQPHRHGAETADPAAGSTLRQRACDFMSAQLADHGGDVRLEFGRGAEHLLEMSEPRYAFEIRLRNRRKLGRIDLQVDIRSAQGEVQTRTLHVKATLHRDVVVAVRAVARGQVIASTDVALERRTFTSFQEIGVTASSRVVGQEARRIIHTGQMIKASDLKPKVLVKRNELLRIRSTGGGVALHTAARALQSGALGDVIEVRNEVSKQTFWAQVTGLRQAQAVGDNDEKVESEQLAREAA